MRGTGGGLGPERIGTGGGGRFWEMGMGCAAMARSEARDIEGRDREGSGYWEGDQDTGKGIPESGDRDAG